MGCGRWVVSKVLEKKTHFLGSFFLNLERLPYRERKLFWGQMSEKKDINDIRGEYFLQSPVHVRNIFSRSWKIK